MADIGIPTVFQFEPAVLHDSIFVTGTGSGRDRDAVLPGFFHGLDGSLFDVLANQRMTMTGVEENGFRINAQVFLQLRPDIRQVGILDRSDFCNGDRVEGHDNGGDFGGFIRQHQGFHKGWIAPSVIVRMGDVDLGGTGQEVLRGAVAGP